MPRIKPLKPIAILLTPLIGLVDRPGAGLLQKTGLTPGFGPTDELGVVIDQGVVLIE